MNIYRIKVSLFYDKRTYRYIEILEDQSFSDLHETIFEAFDRYDEHLYSFFLTGKAMRSIRKMFDFPQVTHPMSLEDGFGFRQEKTYDAEKKRIRDMGLDEKDKF